MKPRTHLFVEIVKAIISLFKNNEKDDWWRKNYKNSYDEPVAKTNREK